MIDFRVMRGRGVLFVILRVSHGGTVDDRFGGYYEDALAAGYAPWQIAFYSFINPKRGSAVATAAATAHFIRDVTGRTDVTYMLDVENYRDEPPDVGSSPVRGPAFATYLRAHRGHFLSIMPGSRVTGYANRAYWNSTLGPNDAQLARELSWLVPRYPLYSAIAYNSRGYPPDPPRWDEYAFGLASGPIPPDGATWHGWQFSAGYNRQGPPYGCQSSDLDLCFFRSEQMAVWFPAPIPEPEPTPPPPPITPGGPDVFIPIDGARLHHGSLVAGVHTFAAPPGTPAEATGLALNLTFLSSFHEGHLTLWSGAAARPGVSQLNWTPGGEAHSGFTVVKLNGGHFAVYCHVAANVILDATGYTMPPIAGPPGDKGDPGDPAAVDPAVIAQIALTAVRAELED